MAINKNNIAKESVFVISRSFNVPREVVWKAFADPEHMKAWWGPKGFKVRVSKMDFRSGGGYLYCLRSPDGKDMWGKFSYHDIIPYEQIAFITSFSDKKGEITRHPMNPTWPLQIHSTFTFTENKGKTDLIIKWTPVSPTQQERKTFENGMSGMNQGWTGTLDRLTEYLRKGAVVRVDRFFNSKAEEVFDAWLDPESAGQWLFATKDGKMLQVDIDARVGGAFIIIEQRRDKKTAHIGKYIKIDRPKCLVFTFGDNVFQDTVVTVMIRSLKKGCELRLTHENVWIGYESRTQNGWSGILNGLNGYLMKVKEMSYT